MWVTFSALRITFIVLRVTLTFLSSLHILNPLYALSLLRISVPDNSLLCPLPLSALSYLSIAGENVTECTGGPEHLMEGDLPRQYTTYCDPRLNYAQGKRAQSYDKRRSIMQTQPTIYAACSIINNLQIYVFPAASCLTFTLFCECLSIIAKRSMLSARASLSIHAQLN